MRTDELEAVGDVAARAFAGAVDRVQDAHRAIARRAFGATALAGQATAAALRAGSGDGRTAAGPGTDAAGQQRGSGTSDAPRSFDGGPRPGTAPLAADVAAAIVPAIGAVHDRIADAVYAGVRGIGTAAVRRGSRTATVVRPADDGRALLDRPAADAVLGALNGAFGERFAAADSPLELGMALRVRECDLPPTPAAIRRAFPLPSGRVAVLVHGLCMTDASWELGPDPDAYYARRLHHDLDYDVVSVRYNSGRRIPVNGAELATLLERLSSAWPGGIRELALIGHSMGGLVSRSAIAVGVESKHRWIDELQDVVTLGSPHLGANLERATATVAWAAGLLPETRFVADLLDLRSAGVLDLRDGALVHDDVPLAVDRWPWGERGTAVPLLEGVRHHAVAVTLGRDPESWAARNVVGDLLVTPSSASSRAHGPRRLAFADDDVVVLGGLHHFDLLHHPRVYAHLRRWLRPTPALPAAGETGDGVLDGDAVEDDAGR